MMPVTVGPFALALSDLLDRGAMNVSLRFDVLQIVLVHTVVDWVKMILGLGSLPPESRHMQVELRLANRSRNRVHYHGTLFLQSAVFVPETRGCSQGIKPRVAIWSTEYIAGESLERLW